MINLLKTLKQSSESQNYPFLDSDNEYSLGIPKIIPQSSKIELINSILALMDISFSFLEKIKGGYFKYLINDKVVYFNINYLKIYGGKSFEYSCENKFNISRESSAKRMFSLKGEDVFAISIDWNGDYNNSLIGIQKIDMLMDRDSSGGSKVLRVSLSETEKAYKGELVAPSITHENFSTEALITNINSFLLEKELFKDFLTSELNINFPEVDRTTDIEEEKSEYVNVKRRRNKIQNEFKHSLQNELNLISPDSKDMINFYDKTDYSKGMIIPSHIKPFRDCDFFEALNGNNGLLLPKIIDSLFDNFLLSFNFQDGKPIISDKVKNMKLLDFINSYKLHQKFLNPERKKFLKKHNERVLGKY